MIPPDIREAIESLRAFALAHLLMANNIDDTVRRYMAQVRIVRAYLDTLPTAPAPDWSKAPDWAQWWAVDANGGAYWHTDEPSTDMDNAQWLSDSRIEWDITSMICPHWSTTLQQRPQP